MGTNSEWFFNREDGQGLVEYSLVLLLVALVVFAIIGSLGEVLITIFDNTANLLKG